METNAVLLHMVELGLFKLLKARFRAQFDEVYYPAKFAKIDVCSLLKSIREPGVCTDDFATMCRIDAWMFEGREFVSATATDTAELFGGVGVFGIN